MNNFVKPFKITLTVMLCVFLIGIVFACAFGLNTFATLGNGQALTYKISEQKDDYSDIISSVKTFLKDNGAKMVTVQTVYDYNDDVYSLMFYFNAKNDIESSVVVENQTCTVSKLQSTEATDVIVLGAIAAAVAIVVIFGYLALRYLKNNWLANSLGFVIVAFLNIFVSYGLVQILGLVGFQYDSSIMTACIFAILFSAFLYSIFASYVRNLAQIKKLDGTELLTTANKSILLYVLIATLVVIIAGILLCIFGGAAVSIVMIPIIVAALVCCVTSIFVTPYIWFVLKNKILSTPTNKQAKAEN